MGEGRELDEAFVTLATNDTYALGCLVLGSSLRRVGTTRQLVVMVTSGVSQSMRQQLSELFHHLIPVDVLDSSDTCNLELLGRPDLSVTFTKFHCWRLTQFKKCVFMDADTMVIQNIDDLFDREELSAAPDAGWPDCFNSGVFVYVPSEETYRNLLSFAVTSGSFDGGDQGLLNLYFKTWATEDIGKHLPFTYNVVSQAFYSYLPAFKQFFDNIKVVHFIGAVKPWHHAYNTSTGTVTQLPGTGHSQEFLQLWWNIFMESVQPNLDPQLGGIVGDLANISLTGDGAYQMKDDRERKLQWEQGQADYMGVDRFDNIKARLDEKMSHPEPSTSGSKLTTESQPQPEPEPPKVSPEAEPETGEKSSSSSGVGEGSSEVPLPSEGENLVVSEDVSSGVALSSQVDIDVKESEGKAGASLGSLEAENVTAAQPTQGESVTSSLDEAPVLQPAKDPIISPISSGSLPPAADITTEPPFSEVSQTSTVASPPCEQPDSVAQPASAEPPTETVFTMGGKELPELEPLDPPAATEPAAPPPAAEPVSPVTEQPSPVAPPPAAEPSPVAPPPATEPSPVAPPPASEPSPVAPLPATEPSPVAPPPAAEPSPVAPPLAAKPSPVLPIPVSKPSPAVPPTAAKPSPAAPPPAAKPSSTAPIPAAKSSPAAPPTAAKPSLFSSPQTAPKPSVTQQQASQPSPAAPKPTEPKPKPSPFSFKEQESKSGQAPTPSPKPWSPAAAPKPEATPTSPQAIAPKPMSPTGAVPKPSFIGSQASRFEKPGAAAPKPSAFGSLAARFETPGAGKASPFGVGLKSPASSQGATSAPSKSPGAPTSPSKAPGSTVGPTSPSKPATNRDELLSRFGVRLPPPKK